MHRSRSPLSTLAVKAMIGELQKEEVTHS